MKGRYLLASLLLVGLIGGCDNKDSKKNKDISPKTDTIIIELGDKLADPSEYLNVDNLDEEDLASITHTSIDYKKVGKQRITYTYSFTSVKFDVVIQDTTAPVITTSLNEGNSLTILQGGSIDYNEPGMYQLFVKATDEYNNTDTMQIPIRIQAVTFDFTSSISLEIGESKKVSVEVNNNQKVTYESSDQYIASVDRYGTVTGNRAGTCIITATVNGVSKDCKVTVNGVKLSTDTTSLTLKVGENKRIRTSCNVDDDIIFISKNKSIATVDDFGVVKAISPGKTTVSVSVRDKTIAVTIIVEEEDTVLDIDVDSIQLAPEDTYKLDVITNSKKAITYTSSDEEVVTVDESGNITALKEGTAIITATSNGVSDSVEVVVELVDITLTFNQDSLVLDVGDIVNVGAASNCGDPILYFTSDDSVATVDESGNITALKEGFVVISATIRDREVICQVEVKASTSNEEPPEVEEIPNDLIEQEE